MRNKVISIKVTYPCPKCEGSMQSAYYSNKNKMYQHICDKCGYEILINKKYPYITYKKYEE